ncbi:choline kinase family protein [Fodinicola acaciae]|uniref:choline kinase family protein n=1 Tax=Fodinicola acaciae TaxID=2681555 RepID=UPI0013D3F265|nr:choline kinase family protein [Fodinicola acaciae]
MDLQPEGSTLTFLSGGTTNRNWRVDIDGQPVAVWREPASDDSLLGIDRTIERRAARQAYEAGVAPPVLATAASGETLTGWIDAPAMAADALLDKGFRTRLCAALKALHAQPLLGRRLDHLESLARFSDGVRKSGLALPDGFDQLTDQAERIAATLGPARDVVPCHNDLSAGNVLDAGDRVWLIDFEYAADGDIAAELGNAVAMSALPPAAVEPLVVAYAGTAELTDRAVLYHALSIIAWIPWLVLQAAAHPELPDIAQWIDLDVRAAVDSCDSAEFATAIRRI